MSFGTFSSRYGSEPSIDLEMAIEADHPFTFSEGQFDLVQAGPVTNINDLAGMQPSDVLKPPDDLASQTTPPAPTLDNEAAKGVGIQMPELPWSIILPIGVIGAFAAGIAWYLTGGKMPDIPV